ncbi:hypothetical protein GCM10027051_03090 [Niabella terrae]
MKAKALIIGAALLLSTAVRAQRSSVKEKVRDVVERIDASMPLDKDKRAETEAVFTSFYTEQEQLRNHLQKPSGLAQGLNRQDFQSVRKKNETLINRRDADLKKILGTEGYKKWKGKIEPSMKNARRKR